MSTSSSPLPQSSAGPPDISALPLPKIPPIDNTYGALLIGTFIGLLLYGVSLYQGYQYVRHHMSDSRYTRSFVLFIIVFDTFYTIQSMHIRCAWLVVRHHLTSELTADGSYWYLVVNYFRPDRLFTGVWSINLFPVTTALSVIFCQCFFAHRVYVVGRRLRPLVALAALMFMAEFGVAVAGTVKAFVLPNLMEFRKVAWTNSAGFTVAVVADIMLTTVLVWVLHRSRTGFRQTNSAIDVLIAYSVTTGLITDIFSVVCLILAFVGPEDLIYAGFDIVCTKLYVNCVLAAINVRHSETFSVPVTASDEENSVGLVKLPPLPRPGHPPTATAQGPESSESTLIQSDTKVFLDVIHIKPS
ncbi:hypothetical protein VTO73DRAFT_1748 [Trametes versicolor]